LLKAFESKEIQQQIQQENKAAQLSEALKYLCKIKKFCLKKLYIIPKEQLKNPKGSLLNLFNTLSQKN
jgi:hypothetical protein